MNTNNQVDLIKFTETPGEEVSRFVKESRVTEIVKIIQANKDLPEDLKEAIIDMISTVVDLFSTSLPMAEQDPVEALRKASRDINLSRILRERGVVRLFQIIYGTTFIPESEDGKEIEVKVYLTLGFETQEDLIDWFTKYAKVSRALVYKRFKAYNKLTNALGYTLDEAFDLIITKPSLIGDSLEDIGVWSTNELISIRPKVAKNLVKQLLPAGDPTRERVEDILDQIDDARDVADVDHIVELSGDLVDVITPALRALVEEIAIHDSSKEAGKFVRNDIIQAPEITYKWLKDTGGISAELVVKGYDPETRTENIEDIITIRFLPDSFGKIPKEIEEHIKRKLSIR